MGRKFEKKVVFRATLSDETTVKLQKLTEKFKSLTKPLDDITSKFRKMNHIISPITRKMERLARSMKKIGKLGSVAITAPATAIATAGILKAADVQSELAKLRVVADLDPNSLGLLKNEAVDIGKRTQYSTTDALEGMKYLAMNGMSDAAAIKNAIAPTMDLTGASRLKSDLPISEIAKILSGTMNAFSIDTKESASVSDKLAYAMQKSSMKMEELGAAMQKAAPLANVSGVDLDTLVSSLMLLSKNTVTGEIAGTAFAGIFSRLLKPPKEAQDVFVKYQIKKEKFFTKDGKFKNIIGFFEELEKKKIKTADIMALMGQEAGKYLVALIGQSKEWRQRLQEVSFESQGVAKTLNEVNMEGLNGKINFLKSSLEAVFINVGDAGPLAVAEDVIDLVNSFLNKIISLDVDKLRSLLYVMGGFAAIPPLLLGLGAVIPSIPIIGGLAAAAGGASLLTSGLGIVASVSAAAGIGAMIATPILNETKRAEKDRIPFAPYVYEFTRPPLQTAQPLPQNSNITLDFRNIPRGTEVKAPNKIRGLDLFLQFDPVK